MRTGCRAGGLHQLMPPPAADGDSTALCAVGGSDATYIRSAVKATQADGSTLPGVGAWIVRMCCEWGPACACAGSDRLASQAPALLSRLCRLNLHHAHPVCGRLDKLQHPDQRCVAGGGDARDSRPFESVRSGATAVCLGHVSQGQLAGSCAKH